MNDAGRILVRETHGIRRFLYPLRTVFSEQGGFDLSSLGLRQADGRPVPSQVTVRTDCQPPSVCLDFALSIGPHEVCELRICRDSPEARIDDPLVLDRGDRYRVLQRRFISEFDRQGHILQAKYDGREHLRSSLSVTRNGKIAAGKGEASFAAGHLAARLSAPGRYQDSCVCRTTLDLTACKSWATVTHALVNPRPRDIVTFELPLAVTADIITCDFGIGGGLYSRLQPGSINEIVWHTVFQADGSVSWSLRNAGRKDFEGDEASLVDWRPKQWFHLIDGGKALAVALTEVPQSCQNLDITLRADGAVTIAFELGEKTASPAVFAVCYHFLNDIPPIAAATNPQSILLPPLVITEFNATVQTQDLRL